MNLNKVASDLFFCGCTVKELHLKNTIVNLPPESNVNIQMGLSIDNIKNDKSSGGLLGYVNLSLDLDTNIPDIKEARCDFHIVLEGCFSTTHLERDDFEKMLSINGGATLYSIARSQILDITSNAFLTGKLLLPMVNMIEFFEESKKQVSDSKQN